MWPSRCFQIVIYLIVSEIIVSTPPWKQEVSVTRTGICGDLQTSWSNVTEACKLCSVPVIQAHLGPNFFFVDNFSTWNTEGDGKILKKWEKGFVEGSGRRAPEGCRQEKQTPPEEKRSRGCIWGGKNRKNDMSLYKWTCGHIFILNHISSNYISLQFCIWWCVTTCKTSGKQCKHLKGLLLCISAWILMQVSPWHQGLFDFGLTFHRTSLKSCEVCWWSKAGTTLTPPSEVIHSPEKQ